MFFHPLFESGQCVVQNAYCLVTSAQPSSSQLVWEKSLWINLPSKQHTLFFGDMQGCKVASLFKGCHLTSGRPNGIKEVFRLGTQSIHDTPPERTKDEQADIACFWRDHKRIQPLCQQSFTLLFLLPPILRMESNYTDYADLLRGLPTRHRGLLR